VDKVYVKNKREHIKVGQQRDGILFFENKYSIYNMKLYFYFREF